MGVSTHVELWAILQISLVAYELYKDICKLGVFLENLSIFCSYIIIGDFSSPIVFDILSRRFILVSICTCDH